MSVPLLGAVTRYQTLLARLWLPHAGDGSLASVVADVVETVWLNGVAPMSTGVVAESFCKPVEGGAGA